MLACVSIEGLLWWHNVSASRFVCLIRHFSLHSSRGDWVWIQLGILLYQRAFPATCRSYRMNTLSCIKPTRGWRGKNPLCVEQRLAKSAGKELISAQRVNEFLCHNYLWRTSAPTKMMMMMTSSHSHINRTTKTRMILILIPHLITVMNIFGLPWGLLAAQSNNEKSKELGMDGRMKEKCKKTGKSETTVGFLISRSSCIRRVIRGWRRE